MQQFDIVIVGAGMTGALLAASLAPSGCSLCLIEQSTPIPFEPKQSMDLRVSAISRNSVKLLEQCGAWDSIARMRAAPYTQLTCWEDEQNPLLFDSSQLGLSHLGYMVENRLIQLGLWEQLKAHSNVSWRLPAKVAELHQEPDFAELTLDSGERIKANLVVAADGAHSAIRQLSGIGVTQWDYRQHCMLINVRCEQSLEPCTWQQFYPSGPRALLPLGGNKASLVWYDSPQKIKALMKLEHNALAEIIMEAFPHRLARIKVEAAGSFPLTRRHAQQYHKGRVVVLGDAAHTIHPMAGQGVNIGFKDVACLSELFHQAWKASDWAGLEWLAQYQKQRKRDNLLMQSAMDLFYLGFGCERFPLKVLRNIGLWGAEHSGPLKKRALKYALGL
ncbi:FAD-dependent monooxygenase [Dongshaea marina]|uniref:FAD-dependent monooxygenase n=1 Tax=Dongshaea marina TaxID=2047966 RepID=UPI000D3E5684|nr:FAD-dependent monooxygenase [Dongshaea marina]